ncbi:HAD-IA family hydrolase [Ferrovum sp. PN-J185]|uniref:HAD family hydrolase n=1 Tax=Ferrovum sp. PN-J185 TaxID=1356306 RepID=UPI00079799D1|nr:HAD-IA family hydrolase [Ferrovum sp. PN-J185]KXW56881.1 phosphoglycolate phosphatase [Ferrovum sp. PN-J185]MCC6069251.1 HAD-IA family hydrolase [Ferrovum sp. PN-J185]MDE1891447.1 HAD-IA family hydrolase [Betaproteobacteria bacterium]MDE2056027.1 HAD-IA family hydrolase [Betaproteobacteria bacterium]
MIKGILFDLDGTLADTAPDLGRALNTLLERYGNSPLPIERLRPRASQGARGLIEEGFNISTSDPFFEELRDQFLTIYESNLCLDTRLFPGVSELLNYLDLHHIPWGIVTNKFERFTNPLVELLGLSQRSGCVVSGDTFQRPKPFPDPLVGAAKLLQLSPQELVYVGDDERDMLAAQAAQMSGIIAGYGYLGSSTPPNEWPHHAIIQEPEELIRFIHYLQ